MDHLPKRGEMSTVMRQELVISCQFSIEFNIRLLC